MVEKLGMTLPNRPHPVYPGGPICSPGCGGEHTIFHEAYAEGYEAAERGADDGTLDAAWHDAELALPEGWRLVYLLGGELGWQAIAEPTPAYERDYLEVMAVRWLGVGVRADTPAGALVALAAKLRRGGE